MQFEKLFISRRYNGEISGNIEFAGDAGKIELSLNDASCKKMFAVIAEEMVAVSKDAADKLTAEIFKKKVEVIENVI